MPRRWSLTSTTSPIDSSPTSQSDGTHLRSLHIAHRGRRGRHVIIYRAVDENVIDVVRILHDAMDLARHLPPEAT